MVFGGSLKVPVGTTGQRLGTAAAGMFRYSSDEGKFEGYTTEWGEMVVVEEVLRQQHTLLTMLP